VPDDCDHTACNGVCWKNYPQSRFPNWTLNQVKKSKIHDAITDYDRTKKCVIYKLDVDKEGIFHDGGTMDVNDSNDITVLDKEWDRFKGDNVRFFPFFQPIERNNVFVAKTENETEGTICREYDRACSAHAWRKVGQSSLYSFSSQCRRPLQV